MYLYGLTVRLLAITFGSNSNRLALTWGVVLRRLGMEKTLHRIEKRLDDHTVKSLVDWADHGHGCNHHAAIASVNLLMRQIKRALLAAARGRKLP